MLNLAPLTRQRGMGQTHACTVCVAMFFSEQITLSHRGNPTALLYTRACAGCMALHAHAMNDTEQTNKHMNTHNM